MSRDRMASYVQMRRSSAIGVGALLVLLAVDAPLYSQSQPFTSGSTGADGALNITAPGVTYLDPKAMKINAAGDNIFNFTTINIAAGSTLKLSEFKLHGPVFFLATGDVTISGTIDLSGDPSSDAKTVPSAEIPNFAGSGGYSGGLGGISGDSTHPAMPGNGPGGGAVGDLGGSVPKRAAGGSFTANTFLVPLVGGSGGGGTADIPPVPFGAQGGAGGGALLIASSTTISGGSVVGNILANGGGGASRGCGGAGGAVRLVANTINAGDNLHVIARAAASGSCSVTPSDGLVRLEANTLNVFINGVGGPLITSVPFALNLPTVPPPTLTVASVDGTPINANPVSFPDKSINTASPVPVVIQATNVPTSAVVVLNVYSDLAGNQAIPVTLQGSNAASSATVQVTFPSGPSRGFVKATWK